MPPTSSASISPAARPIPCAPSRTLYALCRKHFPGSHRIEVIDVLKEPLRALAEAILVTPTVVKVSPAPEQQIIGNLSDEAEVLRALGLPQKERA